MPVSSSGEIRISSDKDTQWLRLTYEKGIVKETFFIDIEEEPVIATRRYIGRTLREQLIDMMPHLPRIAAQLDGDENLSKFSDYLRDYFDNWKQERRNAEGIRDIPQHEIFYEPFNARHNAYVFFFRKGNAYEELIVSSTGKVVPIRREQSRGGVRKSANVIDILERLPEFADNLQIHPQMREYASTLADYARSRVN